MFEGRERVENAKLFQGRECKLNQIWNNKTPK